MQITHVITSLDDGGAEAALYRLCTHVTRHQYTIICLMGEGKYGPLLKRAGFTVHCLEMPRGRLSMSGLWRLWRVLRDSKPDVVQTWMYHADLVGGVIARLSGLPNVVWGIHHTTLEVGKSSRFTVLIAHLLARLSHFVPVRIAVCAEKAVLVHRELGYAADKMVVIPNGYDLVRFAPQPNARLALRMKWSIPQDQPLLGFVGRFDPLKDIGNLVSALRIVKDRGTPFHCVLAGTGLTRENTELIAQIEENGLQDILHLLGRRTDVPEVMSALDILVLSSCSEAFPNVLAEAMACGTPCVTTDVGDAALIVGKSGWVVPPANAAALAGGIDIALQAMRSPTWVRLQLAARERIVDNFSLDRMVGAYTALWEGAATYKLAPVTAHIPKL